ncbi:MAG: rhodanese-like domain-containing protein [Alphaproteobacteria bacterium]|nr:MAG: rhodanese-like domain-containing protein [Alphaproteobacteria bacterium]
MNKQHLSYFAAILVLFLIIASGIAGAGAKSQCTVPNVYKNVTANDTKKMLENDVLSVPGDKIFILDVRTPAEYNYGHIAGAKLIPLKNVPSHDPVNLSANKLLAKRLNELPNNKSAKILVYCKVGGRGAAASQMLVDAGYKKVYNLQGGIDAWVSAGYPTVVDSNFWTNNYPKVVPKVM